MEQINQDQQPVGEQPINFQTENKSVEEIPKETLKFIQDEVHNQITDNNILFRDYQLQQIITNSNNTIVKLKTLSFSLGITSLFNMIFYRNMNLKFKTTQYFTIEKDSFKEKNIILPMIISSGVYLSICYCYYKRNKALSKMNDIHDYYYFLKNSNCKNIFNKPFYF